jgi:hypothetical protein
LYIDVAAIVTVPCFDLRRDAPMLKSVMGQSRHFDGTRELLLFPDQRTSPTGCVRSTLMITLGLGLLAASIVGLTIESGGIALVLFSAGVWVILHV